jgi:molybdenum cofactor cytidylyltransferase
MDAKIAAIVLAAGRSSRLAPRNKLLEIVEGQAIVAHAAAAAIASGADPVVVVTGFEAARVAEAHSHLDEVVVHNPAFADGLSGSLRTGVEALPADCDGALILLGDMPKIDSGVLTALMAAFAARDAICVPMREGKRGNPILWGAAHFAEMMSLTGDAGAKRMLPRHEARVREVPVASSGIFTDVDTPSDLARLKQTNG